MPETSTHPDADVIIAAARERGITRLVHFTPLINLLSIVEMRAIIARDRVIEIARQKADQHLLDYIDFNDRLRLDRHTRHINLSVQHPNSSLFRRFREACTWCDVWCVLLVTPEYLALPGVLFSRGNAASSYVRRTGTGSSAADFLALFAEEQVTANQYGTRSIVRSGLASCYPTDPQAEVMVPDEIPLCGVDGFAFESETARIRAAAALRVLLPDATLPELVVIPELYQERAC